MSLFFPKQMFMLHKTLLKYRARRLGVPFFIRIVAQRIIYVLLIAAEAAIMPQAAM